MDEINKMNRFVTMNEYSDSSIIKYIENSYQNKKNILIYQLSEDKLDSLYRCSVKSFHKNLIGAYNEIYDDIEFAPYNKSDYSNFGRYYLNKDGFFFDPYGRCFYDTSGLGLNLDGEEIYTSMSFDDIVDTYAVSKKLKKVK